MRAPPFPRGTLARVGAASALCGTLAILGPQALAATAAGQQIKNVAVVTYQNAAGETFEATSNEAVVTVAQVYSATIGVDSTKSAAPGETVYFPYELTNLGNGTDSYDVTAVAAVLPLPIVAPTSIKLYLDSNGNGRPDGGEPELLTPLSLDAGKSASVVVALQVPAIALTGAKAGVTLTALATNGTNAVVTDLSQSPAKGLDGLDSTVQSYVTVTNDAVLAMTKTSSHDIVNRRITYTISVTNTGNTVARDVVLFDGLPAGTTLFGTATASGLLDAADVAATYTAKLEESAADRIRFNLDGVDTDATEADIGLDLDSDGSLSASGDIPGVYARDDALAPNASISLTFTVQYPATLDGGTAIANVAHLTADVDGDGLDADDLADSSTRALDTLLASYAVDIADTDGVSAASPLDVQRVASVATGGTADFDVVVANGGNAADTFELSVDPGTSNTFPVGTVFTFYDIGGTTRLIDSNGRGGVDTGVIAKGATRTVRVRATLPQGFSGDNGGAGFTADVRSVSAGDLSVVPSADATSTTSIDLVGIKLDAIVAAVADIHTSTTTADAPDEDALGASPYTVSRTIEAGAGTTVDVPVFIDNQSAQTDTYRLSAGSSLTAADLLGSLPSGWSVQFFPATDDGAGNLTQSGGAITSVSVPASTNDFPVIARVTIAANATADVLYDIDGGDAGGPVRTTNGDADGDYPLFLRIVSPTSGAKDTMLEAIDVTGGRTIAFSPDATDQVESGGTVDYLVTLRNDSNSAETVEITSANSQPGFTNTVSIDTDFDGTGDLLLGSLTAGPITFTLPDGSNVIVQVTDDGDAFPELVLPPGFDLPLVATVLAPTSALASQIDVLTLVATNAAGVADASVSLRTAIVDSAIRLIKTVAIDKDCDGDNLDEAVGERDFKIVQNVQVAPQECALWRIVAENQGDVDALNVFVTDAVTLFSEFLDDSLTDPVPPVTGNSFRACFGDGCTPAALPLTGALQVFASENASVIRFNVGTGATAGTAATNGGTLQPGQKVTLQFGVRVQ